MFRALTRSTRVEHVNMHHSTRLLSFLLPHNKAVLDNRVPASGCSPMKTGYRRISSLNSETKHMNGNIVDRPTKMDYQSTTFTTVTREARKESPVYIKSIKKRSKRPPTSNFSPEGILGLTRELELRIVKDSSVRIAGVDEAGRGCLAGPVVAAACIIPMHVKFEGVNDSKKLSPTKRKRLFDEIIAHPDVQYCIIEVDNEEIDSINILQASLKAMERAVNGLNEAPHHILVDGPSVPLAFLQNEKILSKPIVKGDSRVFSIACASVLAKEHRDRVMKTFHEKYPEYGFAQNKGYPTKAHRKLLLKFGPTPIHRRSFGPVKNAIVDLQNSDGIVD